MTGRYVRWTRPGHRPTIVHDAGIDEADSRTLCGREIPEAGDGVRVYRAYNPRVLMDTPRCRYRECDRPARKGWTMCARHYSAGKHGTPAGRAPYCKACRKRSERPVPGVDTPDPREGVTR